jgi:hypothetical protein
MLENIINSKADSAVLAFFMAAPERSFSLKEVAKRLRLPSLKVARSLGKLARHGFLKNFYKRGNKYCIINSRHPLLPQLKNYWKRRGPKYQDELLTAIKKLGRVKAAFLSGVFTGYANLPVDLLLVGKVNLRKLSDFLKSAKKLMGQEINYSVMTVDEFLLRRDTFDRFIKDIFDYRHITVLDELTKK